MRPLRSYHEVVTGLLRSLWSAPRAVPPPPRRVWRDGVLLGAVVAVAVLEGVLRTDLVAPVVSVLGVVVIAPTVLWRRTRPLSMLLIAVVVGTPLQFVLPVSLMASAFVLVLVYALYRWGSGRDLVLGTATLIGVLGITMVAGDGLDEVIGGFAVLLATAVVGIAFRYRASARVRSIERIRMLQREQLARDLHDTVAHHVSAIAIRAQAGMAMAAHDPAAATDSLAVIEAEAAKTLGELRSMVRVLRHGDSAEVAPSPRLADVGDLAGTRSGVTVAVQVEGDDGSIPPPVAAAVYRLAQESVTNALRHARQVARVEVVVEADADGIRLSVTNDGSVPAAPSPGFGIVGMMERAALLGGTCQAGPAPGGGWAVTAILPRRGWTA